MMAETDLRVVHSVQLVANYSYHHWQYGRAGQLTQQAISSGISLTSHLITFVHRKLRNKQLANAFSMQEYIYTHMTTNRSIDVAIHIAIAI